MAVVVLVAQVRGLRWVKERLALWRETCRRCVWAWVCVPQLRVGRVCPDLSEGRLVVVGVQPLACRRVRLWAWRDRWRCLLR